MRALVYTEPKRVEMRDVPEPEVGPDDVLVQVVSCGVCGSDVHGFLGSSRIRIPPMVMGHEFIGTIAEVGSEVQHLHPGNSVVVQPVIGCGHCKYCLNGRPNICPQRRLLGGHLPGAFAERVSVPARVVYSLASGVGVAGVLIEPLGNVVHMLRLAEHALYDQVVVLGAGTLGLLTVRLARLAGARQIVVTDTSAHRLGVAERMGADLAVDARGSDVANRIQDMTGGGADVIFDCAGISATRRLSVEIAHPGATVVLLGNAEADSPLPMLDLINREITLRGSYSCTDEEFRRAIAIVEDKQIDATEILQLMGLDSGPRLFGRLATDPGEVIKAVFQIGAPAEITA